MPELDDGAVEHQLIDRGCARVAECQVCRRSLTPELGEAPPRGRRVVTQRSLCAHDERSSLRLGVVLRGEHHVGSHPRHRPEVVDTGERGGEEVSRHGAGRAAVDTAGPPDRYVLRRLMDPVVQAANVLPAGGVDGEGTGGCLGGHGSRRRGDDDGERTEQREGHAERNRPGPVGAERHGAAFPWWRSPRTAPLVVRTVGLHLGCLRRQRVTGTSPTRARPGRRDERGGSKAPGRVRRSAAQLRDDLGGEQLEGSGVGMVAASEVRCIGGGEQLTLRVVVGSASG